QLYLDGVTDNGGAAAVPAPAHVPLADVERSAMSKAKWYQVVSVTLGERLDVYDLSPAEYLRSPGCTTCPCQFGFGMIPASAGATAAMACNGTTFPSGRTPNAMEVLISTAF